MHYKVQYSTVCAKHVQYTVAWHYVLHTYTASKIQYVSTCIQYVSMCFKNVTYIKIFSEDQYATVVYMLCNTASIIKHVQYYTCTV